MGHWWGNFAPTWAARYSLILGTSAIVGAVIHRSKTEGFHGPANQQVLLGIFCLVVWFSHIVGVGPSADPQAVKVTKFTAIILMSGLLITNQRRYNGMIWVYILTGLYLGYEAFQAPDWAFVQGRLARGIGGSDFAETNFLGAHFAMLLPFIGVMFLNGDWKRKALCVLSGGFVFNGLVLCRSRGVFLGVIVGGISALFGVSKEIRKKVLVALLIGAVGGALLVDPRSWERFTQLHTDVAEMDKSAAGRIAAWKAALAMLCDHPLGVGEGNFKALVGRYDSSIPGKDAHNTALRCGAELGWPGLTVYLLIVLNAFKELGDVKKRAQLLVKKDQTLLNVYGLRVALITFLTAGLFITHTYIEELYWLLMMPLFLRRAVEHELRKEDSDCGKDCCPQSTSKVF